MNARNLDPRADVRHLEPAASAAAIPPAKETLLRAIPMMPPPARPRRAALCAGLCAVVGSVILLLLVDPQGLSAQQGPGSSLAAQSMRPYQHVFWAYALAWAIVLGWVISLGRRWSQVEDDLGEGSRHD